MRSSRTIENSLHNRRGLFRFFGVLTVLMSLAALAQINGAGPAYAKAHTVSALPGADNGGHVSGIRVKTVASVTHSDTPVQRVSIVESYGRVHSPLKPTRAKPTHRSSSSRGVRGTACF